MSLIYKALQKAEREGRGAGVIETNILKNKPAGTDLRPVQPRSNPFWIILFFAVLIFSAIYIILNGPGLEKSKSAFLVPINRDEAGNGGMSLSRLGGAPALRPSTGSGLCFEAPPRKDDEEKAVPPVTVSGIIYDNNSSLAIVNGKVMSAGDVTSEGFKIKRIDKDSITLEFEGKEIVVKK